MAAASLLAWPMARSCASPPMARYAARPSRLPNVVPWTALSLRPMARASLLSQGTKTGPVTSRGMARYWLGPYRPGWTIADAFFSQGSPRLIVQYVVSAADERFAVETLAPPGESQSTSLD